MILMQRMNPTWNAGFNVASEELIRWLLYLGIPFVLWCRRMTGSLKRERLDLFGISVFRAVRLIDSCVAITELTQHFFHSKHEEVDWFPQALPCSIVRSLLSLNSIQISMFQLVFFFLVMLVSLSFCPLHWPALY
jgi:hypothetical protein